MLGSTPQNKWVSRCTWKQICLWGNVFCALHASVSQSFIVCCETEHSRQISIIKAICDEDVSGIPMAQGLRWRLGLYEIQVIHCIAYSCLDCLFLICMLFQFSQVNHGYSAWLGGVSLAVGHAGHSPLYWWEPKEEYGSTNHKTWRGRKYYIPPSFAVLCCLVCAVVISTGALARFSRRWASSVCCKASSERADTGLCQLKS